MHMKFVCFVWFISLLFFGFSSELCSGYLLVITWAVLGCFAVFRLLACYFLGDLRI